MKSLYRFLFLIMSTFLLIALHLQPSFAGNIEPGTDVEVHFKNGDVSEYTLVSQTQTHIRLETPGLPEIEVSLDTIESIIPVGQLSKESTPVEVVPTADAAEKNPVIEPVQVKASASVVPSEGAPPSEVLGHIKRLLASGKYQLAISTAMNDLQDHPRQKRQILPLLESAFDQELDRQTNNIRAIRAPDQIRTARNELSNLIQNNTLYAPILDRLAISQFNRKRLLARVVDLWSVTTIHEMLFLNENDKMTRQQKIEQVKLWIEGLIGKGSVFKSFRLAYTPVLGISLGRMLYYVGDSANAQISIQKTEKALESYRNMPSVYSESLIAEIQRELDQYQADMRLGFLPTLVRQDTTKKLADSIKPTPTPAPEKEGVDKAKAVSADLYQEFIAPVVDIIVLNQQISIVVATVVVLFWLFPFMLLRYEIGKGEILASLHKPQVKKFGLIGYVIYLLAKKNASSKQQENEARESGSESEVTTGSVEVKQSFFARLFSKKKSASDASDGKLFCASCNKATDNLNHYMHNLKFNACPHCGVEMEAVFQFEEYLRHLIDALISQAEATGRKKKKSKELANSKSMSQLTQSIYTLSLRRRATDIHIERTDIEAIVQFRIDGMLSKIITIPPLIATAFMASIKVHATLDITNHMTPQDGRYSIKIDEVEFDIRINCAPTPDGEVIFMRMLDQRRIMITPKELGFEGKGLEHFEYALRRPHGLFLVTGPTGSGKSTTLYVGLRQINTGEKNIITIEDPVEYRIPGLKQMQVNPDKDFTFANGLRSILRQDPDVIMVGEVRDSETAAIAIDAAITGHLVFTTLHTMDTPAAIARLDDLGVDPKRYAQALEIILAQRLLRTTCPECKQPVEVQDAQLERLGILKLRHSIKFMAGIGCEHCNYTGYYGRIAIQETFIPNEEIRNLLENKPSQKNLREVARRNGMRLLHEEGIMRVISGKTTVEEVIRVTC